VFISIGDCLLPIEAIGNFSGHTCGPEKSLKKLRKKGLIFFA
jgi:hypothetical protein